MFDEFEKNIMTCGYFDILNWMRGSVEAMSRDTGHYWVIKKFDKEGYPGLVLYHSHDGERYHVHFCYKNQDIAPAVSEIMSHDRYQKRKLKQRDKVAKMSNNELLRAI